VISRREFILGLPVVGNRRDVAAAYGCHAGDADVQWAMADANGVYRPVTLPAKRMRQHR
jgi:hypothetical protein